MKSHRKVKTISYCVGGRHYSLAKSSELDRSDTVRKCLSENCNESKTKQSLVLSDKTIDFERLINSPREQKTFFA